MTPVLQLTDITVRFGGLVAVEHASLTIRQGDLIGFIGPNGAGKTTLMRVITGIVIPDEGQVLFVGTDVTQWPVVRRVQAGLAFAQQLVQPFRSLTALENVAAACGANKNRHPLRSLFMTDTRAERERAMQLLARVGLESVADRLPTALPLGMRKRLEMARAMALEPRLLLLDEPLAGLNQAEAHVMGDLIQGLNRQGQTILLIEHNLRQVLRICPRLYVQDRGRPLAFGEAASVMADPAVRSAYLGGHA